MKVRRVAVPMLIVLAAVAVVAWQCPPTSKNDPGGQAPAGGESTPTATTPTATKYVVIVPPEEGGTRCRIVPDPRLADGKGSLTFLNLSDARIKIELPAALAATAEPTLVFYLEKDESRVVPLADPKSGVHPYGIEGPTGGCLTGLPTPKVIIP